MEKGIDVKGVDVSVLYKLLEYHNQIGDAFLSKGGTPFKILKRIWKIHAEMETWLVIHNEVSKEYTDEKESK